MVDFSKRIGKPEIAKKINPLEIYENLDRATDKSGPLRPAQIAVLTEWHEKLRKTRDIIVKLHTGQGKTLIGLLMLQSKINENGGSALYLCPNKFLVRQTCVQAKKFGIKFTTIQSQGEIPEEFTDGKAILIASVHKVFNGKTKFGLGPGAQQISAILMDDSHACIDALKKQCTIQILQQHPAYQEIKTLFGPSLNEQGSGTYQDILNGSHSALLPVPYWDWQDKHSEVSSILSKYNDQEIKNARQRWGEQKTISKKGEQLKLPANVVPNTPVHTRTESDGKNAKGDAEKKKSREDNGEKLMFVWPILRDIISECQCLISGTQIEITPYSVPLRLFGTYDRATTRIFMSATVTDDAFLIKGLGLSPQTIQRPLGYDKERWSGEKMILIPSLIDESLDRATIAKKLAVPLKDRAYGVVVLSPSFDEAGYWKKNNAEVADKESIYTEIENLKAGNFEKVLVIANRYDGIDLPDETCRILILDSKPYAESLEDRYLEERLGSSDVIATKTARIIEQGLGRSVRGEKDYSVIVLMGSDLIKTIKTEAARRYFSNQTRTQIEIGRKIVQFSEEDMKKGTHPMTVFMDLIEQCLDRNEHWKEFYKEQMDAMTTEERSKKTLEIFAEELKAENRYQEGATDEAVQIIQALIDKHFNNSPYERGWYLQVMARYTYPRSKRDANQYQVAAHKANPYLLRPKEGMVIAKMLSIGQRRISNIREWIQKFPNFDEMLLSLDEVLSRLAFGVEADRFEQALHELGAALGFTSQRPEKEWKAGPDNLWLLKDGEYLLVECKNMVELTRPEINKAETGQMNNACAWFDTNYPGTEAKRIMIINTRTVGRAAGFNHSVEVMRETKLRRLIGNVRKFFAEFRQLDLKDLADLKIQEYLSIHQLTVEKIVTEYSESVRALTTHGTA